MPDSTQRLALLLSSGPMAVRLPALDRVVEIGRAVGADLLLPDAQVSRRHARIEPNAGRLLLRDLGGRAGVELNGRRLAPGTAQPLLAGDCIGIAAWRFEVVDAAQSTPAPECALIDDLVPAGATRYAGADPSPDLAAFARFAARAGACVDIAALDQVMAGEARQLGGLDAVVVLAEGARGGVRILAADPPAARPEGVSRGLLRAAADSGVVLLDGADRGALERTLVGLPPAFSMCVALRGDTRVDAWLYGWRRAPRPAEQTLGHYLRGLGELGQALRGALRQRLAAERHRRLEADLDDAHRVQQRMLPAADAHGPGWRSAHLFEPGRAVSGDLLLLADHGAAGCALALGDVSGSGAAAALVMAQLAGVLQLALDAGLPLVECAERANRMLLRLGGGRFATLVLARLAVADDVLEVLDAGHGLLRLAAPQGDFAPREFAGGPPLGVVDAPYASERVAFPPGARLLLLSDGISELGNASGEAFGSERAAESMAGADSASMKRLAEAMARWSPPESVPDDASALLLERVDR